MLFMYQAKKFITEQFVSEQNGRVNANMMALMKPKLMWHDCSDCGWHDQSKSYWQMVMEDGEILSNRQLSHV